SSMNSSASFTILASSFTSLIGMIWAMGWLFLMTVTLPAARAFSMTPLKLRATSVAVTLMGMASSPVRFGLQQSKHSIENAHYYSIIMRNKIRKMHYVDETAIQDQQRLVFEDRTARR